MTLSIGGVDGVEIGPGHPCRFIAEISNNHNGDYARAIRLIDAAKAAGADFVKFQCYTPNELVALRGDGLAPEPWGSQGFTMRTLYQKAATPLEWFPELFQHARDIGIVPFASVFGLESLAVLERCAAPAYKIAAFDSTDRGLALAVASRGKPVLVSRRGGWAEQQSWYHGEAHRLYCPIGYPTPLHYVQIPDSFGASGFVGFSSHCLHPDLPIAAVARGAHLIEMHFMLDDEPSELEANVSLTASQFGTMVRRVREVEAMLA